MGYFITRTRSLPDIHAFHRGPDFYKKLNRRRESEPMCTKNMGYRVPDRLPVDDRDEDADSEIAPNVDMEKIQKNRPNDSEPQRIGYYEIYHTIGEGAYATVKKAKHRFIKNEVAVKIIQKSGLDAVTYQRLDNELKILKSVDHPNIIKIHEVIEDYENIYIFTELAERGELHDDIVKHRYSERKAKRKFWQLISGIEYLHNKGIVHRDLKAENILLDRKQQIKIADFGFGSFIYNRTHINTCCGSPPYAAPEMFIGNPYRGPPVDIWSLGVCLYAMTTGTMPFEGKTSNDLRKSVLKAKFRAPYFLSFACEDLLKKILVKDPQNRATFAQIKSHPWMEREIYEDKIFNEHRAHYCVSRGASETCSLDFLAKLGFEREVVQTAIANKHYDHRHGMFNLLMENYHRKHYDKTLEEIKRIHREQGKREEDERRIMAKHPRPCLNDLRETVHFQTMDSGAGSLTSEISRQSTYSDDVHGDEGIHMSTSTASTPNTPNDGTSRNYHFEAQRKNEYRHQYMAHHSPGVSDPIRDMLFRPAVEAPIPQFTCKRSSTDSVNQEIATMQLDGSSPEKRSCPTPPYKRPDTPSVTQEPCFPLRQLKTSNGNSNSK